MIELKPISAGFGADISGIDLARVAVAEFEFIYQAWLDYAVLRFREQTLDTVGLQRFSQRFGPLEKAPLGRMSEQGQAEYKEQFGSLYVTNISNIVENGRPIGGLGNAEASWHSDMTYIETPPPASLLLAVEVPLKGGNTSFANQYAAYHTLPDELKAKVERLSIKHDASHTSVGKLRPGFEEVDDPRDAPGAKHPIICRHAETGRKCLYLGRREWAYVVGLSLDESESLLDELWNYAALTDNTIVQQWRMGDLVMWDNRCVLHRRDDINPSDRRLLRRCQVLARPEGCGRAFSRCQPAIF